MTTPEFAQILAQKHIEPDNQSEFVTLKKEDLIQTIILALEANTIDALVDFVMWSNSNYQSQISLKRIQKFYKNKDIKT